MAITSEVAALSLGDSRRQVTVTKGYVGLGMDFKVRATTSLGFRFISFDIGFFRYSRGLETHQYSRPKGASLFDPWDLICELCLPEV